MASDRQVEIEIDGDSKLHSMLRAIPQLPTPQDWRISRASRIREIVGGDDYDSNLVRIGPLHRRDARWDYGFVAAIKMLYLRSLILRGHASSEEAEVVTKYLRCIEGMADAILQHYDAPENHFANPKELVEMMVFDGCFIIEVIVKYWMQKNREDLLPTDIDFVESDLISVENQIPFFVLEELFRVTVVPELATRDGGRELLRNLALFYLTRGAAKQVPEGYNGPIYHLLHLLHISLCAPPQVITRPSPSRKIKLLWRLIGRRSWAAPVSWLLWKVMPPARELQRLGVRFKPKMTHQFANITFDEQNGTLEIPPLSFSQFHRRLASNLVAMELEQSWPSTERHFCSYVMFVKELITAEEDVAMLVEKRIIVCSVQEGWRGVQHFAGLVRLNLGGEYQRHFEELIRAVNRYYEHASKAMRAVYFC